MTKNSFALSPISDANLVSIDTVERIRKSNDNSLWFNGKEFKFPPALFLFIELNSHFTPVIDQYYREIRTKFDDNFIDIDDIAEKTDDFLNAIFKPLTDYAVKQLSFLGCYDIDPDEFYHRYVEPKFEKILRVKEECDNQIQRLEEEQDERNQMRTARRKAAVKAARRESGSEGDWTNLGHGILNTTARILDASENAKERDKLFKKGKYVIINELEWICSDMAGSVAHAFYKSTGIDIRDPRTPEDYRKAEVIFKNLKSGSIAKAQLMQATWDVFSLNPQEEGFLPWCVEQFDDLSGEIENAAKIFHVDVAKTKRKKMEAAIKLDTEADAVASKKALEDLQVRLSFIDQELMKKVDDALIAFDLEYRTVEGVEYKTREEADVARQELEEVKKVSERYPLDNLENCQAFLDAIASLNLKTAVADQNVKAARDAFAKFDLEYRTVDGVEYKTREEADVARQELEEVKKVSERYPLDNPELCQAFLNAVAALGLKTRVADNYVKTARERSSQQKDTLSEIVRKYKMSQNDAGVLLTRHSALARSGLSNLKMFDLVNTSTADMATIFNVQDDDIVLGLVNLYNNATRGGILVSKKGFYSQFVPFKKTPMGSYIMFIVKYIGILILLMIGLLIISTIAAAIKWGVVVEIIESFVVPSAWLVLFVVMVIMRLVSQKLGWGKVESASFVPLGEISISLSDNKKKLYLNNMVFIPYNQTQKHFEQMKEMVKVQQELG